MVPKGTGLIMPPCALHASTAAWGPDAGRWRPERWLGGATVAAAKLTPAGTPRFLAFFEGPGNCIGQHLALVRPSGHTCSGPVQHAVLKGACLALWVTPARLCYFSTAKTDAVVTACPLRRSLAPAHLVLHA